MKRILQISARRRALASSRAYGLCLATVTTVWLAATATAQASAATVHAVRSPGSRQPTHARTLMRAHTLSDPVPTGGVVRLHWNPVPGATGYVVLLSGKDGHVVTERPVARVSVQPAQTSVPGAVQVFETTGYQSLGSAASSGHVASGAAALLSPLSSLSITGAATVLATPAKSLKLGAASTGAYVRNQRHDDARYGVAAIVHGKLRRVAGISDAAVIATPAAARVAGTTITVDSSRSFQRIAGFGATLNDSSAYDLTRGVAGLGTAAGEHALAAEPALADLFSPTAGIGLSYLRVSIGGNDFAQADYSKPASLANEYTENDPTPGSTATTFSSARLTSFISHDLEYQVPVLQAALALNPALKIMAAPWTAPIWMKCENTAAETGASCQKFASSDLQSRLSGNPGYAGGTLNPADVDQYADYLLEFILAYRAQGLTVSAISLGNEPDNGTWDYPSMEISPAVEAQVAAVLSADMKAAGVSATIIGLDHNWNTTYAAATTSSCGSSCYANQLQSDAATGKSVGALGFHCYGGSPSAQDTITLAIYETECTALGFYTADQDSAYPDDYSTTPMTFAQDLRADTDTLVMNALRDGDSGGVAGAGSKTVMLWNLAANSQYGPTINSGCTETSSAGACLPVEELTNPDDPTFQVGYYILGQLSRFVQPGALRIASSESGDLETVAFKNPDGQIALEVLDNSPVDCPSLSCVSPNAATPFTVDADGHTFTATIEPGAVQTYVWSA